MIAMTALVTMAIDWESAASVGVKARTIATPWRAETGSREFRKPSPPPHQHGSSFCPMCRPSPRAGYKDYELDYWLGMLAPVGMLRADVPRPPE
jgi:hypothetical protein